MNCGPTDPVGLLVRSTSRYTCCAAAGVSVTTDSGINNTNSDITTDDSDNTMISVIISDNNSDDTIIATKINTFQIMFLG